MRAHAAIVLILAACSSTSPRASPRDAAAAGVENGGGARSTTRQLATELEAAIGDLSYYPAHDDAVARFWARPGNPGELEAVLDDPAASGKARFVAAEILFEKDFTFIERHDQAALASLYVEALVGRYTGHANAWGMLEAGSRPGVVGGHLLALGEPAIAALRPLLADATTVDWYQGSEEATVGNGYRYRLKDFAAWYLARLIGFSLPHHATPGPRDAEIVKLEAALP